MAEMGGGHDGCRIYLVTPPKLEPAAFTDLLAAALDASGPSGAGPDPAVAAVQLRLKDVDDDDWRRAIDALRPVVQSRDVAFLLNDRADLVRATGCDGAHVGQEDMPARQARALMGPEATLGVTCKGSRDLAMQAGEDSADYVAFGAFFPSGTKEVTRFIDPEILQWWSELMQLPCCAIGGITAENCAPLVRAGADFLAVVGCVWQHPNGPAAGVRALNAAIGRAQGSE
jgi:thiamine-phosphate pyrophosphorylase